MYISIVWAKQKMTEITPVFSIGQWTASDGIPERLRRVA